MMQFIDPDARLDNRERWLERELCAACREAYFDQMATVRRLAAQLERQYGHLAEAIETWPR